MLKLPFFESLESSKRILLAGAGGGFDIFCGLPLFFALRNAGKEVHLASLSFSALSATKAERLSPALFKAVVLASLPQELSPSELKRQLFERLYGQPAPF